MFVGLFLGSLHDLHKQTIMYVTNALFTIICFVCACTQRNIYDYKWDTKLDHTLKDAAHVVQFRKFCGLR